MANSTALPNRTLMYSLWALDLLGMFRSCSLSTENRAACFVWSPIAALTWVSGQTYGRDLGITMRNQHKTRGQKRYQRLQRSSRWPTMSVPGDLRQLWLCRSGLEESNHMLEICLWVGTFYDLDHFTLLWGFALTCCSDIESRREWENQVHGSYSGHNSGNLTVCLSKHRGDCFDETVRDPNIMFSKLSTGCAPPRPDPALFILPLRSKGVSYRNPSNWTKPTPKIQTHFQSL